MTSSSVPTLHPRTIGSVNWLGLGTLIDKEIERFLKIFAQTIMAPVVATLLFFAVFAFAFGGNQRSIGTVSYLTFLAPGLVMMSMAENAFMNTAISLVLSKINGNIVDVLMPPLSSFELTVGYATGGIVRGLAVGVASVACLSLFADMSASHFFFVLYYALMGSMMLSLLGVITGIWSEKFDHMAAIQSFLILPATFLSGTFYTTERLPESWRFICHMNPFFYVIDGFRYGFIGKADGSLFVGLVLVFVINLGLLGAAYALFESGYKLKA
jgi:ABC-2 type transport system permease protein